TFATLKAYRAGQLTPVEVFLKKHNADGDYFELKNLPAHRLSEIFVVTIGDKDVIFTALSYGYLVKRRSNDEKLKTLCCALYDYAMAAEAYFESPYCGAY
ncbi:MAG: hypothetical protein II762_08850, partial [Ruminococcus sp.]|nr:hypothetical protein [Ruminococcus sp.]